MAYLFVNYGVAPERFYEMEPQLKAFYIAAAKYADEDTDILIHRRIM